MTFDPQVEKGKVVGMVNFNGGEDHVVKFLWRSEQNVCSAGRMGGSKPHPRVFGAFALFDGVEIYARSGAVLRKDA